MQMGAEFAAHATAGDVFALVGNLGSGKTHWTKGFISYFNPDATATSPTFSIVNEYPVTNRTLYHFDFYRLKSAEELIDIGWDEYLDDQAIVICEWANLFPELLPENSTWLEFKQLDEKTRIVRSIVKPSNG